MSSKTRIKQIILDSNWTAAGSSEYQLKNIGNPTDLQDVATKYYVDAAITGSTFTGANGITTTTGDTVELGGILNKNTTISGDSKTFTLGTSTNRLSSYTMWADTSFSLSTNFSSSQANIVAVIDTTTISGSDGVGNISRMIVKPTQAEISSPGGLFIMANAGNVFRDTRTGSTAGIEYYANYSSGFTNRSLVDKQYVDNAITGVSSTDTYTTGSTLVGSTLVFNTTDALSAYTADVSTLLNTAGSGINLGGTAINLGGALSADATITGGGSWNVNLGNGGSRLAGFTTNALTNTITGTNGATSSSIDVTPTTLTLTSSTGSTFTLNSTSNIFTDNSSALQGIKYGANYATTFTNRSLVDKEYVDGVAAGLDPKASVQATTTGNITLSGLTVQGGGDWNTGLTAGDRILVKNQASAVDNGIYVAATGAWSRAADSDGTPSNEVTLGNYTFVEGQNSGNTQSGTGWVIVSSNAADPKNQIVPGTDTQVWSKYSDQTTLSNGNGTTANGSAVDLGGTLTQSTSINGNGQYLEFGNFGSKTSLFQVVADTAVDLWVLGTGVSGKLGLTTGNAVLITNNALVGQFGQTRATSGFTSTGIYTTGSTKTELQINNGSTVFTDTNNPSTAGIQYAADYSATYVNRSLVDKEYVDNSITAITKSITTEYNAAAISGFTGGTGVLATDPFGSDVLDADMTPAVYLNGIKYKVGNATTTGVDCWFAAVGVPGTAIAFNALTNALTLVWSVTNSTIPIDTSDDVSVVYTKVV